MLVSITRLRLRSWRFLLPFAIQASRSRGQAVRSEGCLSATVRKTEGLTFWTLTSWEAEADLRRFMLASPHRTVMSRLEVWCDEAAVAHWVHEGATPPGWDEASSRLKAHGRLSRVRHPSPQQQAGIVNIA